MPRRTKTAEIISMEESAALEHAGGEAESAILEYAKDEEIENAIPAYAGEETEFQADGDAFVETDALMENDAFAETGTFVETAAEADALAEDAVPAETDAFAEDAVLAETGAFAETDASAENESPTDMRFPVDEEPPGFGEAAIVGEPCDSDESTIAEERTDSDRHPAADESCDFDEPADCSEPVIAEEPSNLGDIGDGFSDPDGSSITEDPFNSYETFTAEEPTGSDGFVMGDGFPASDSASMEKDAPGETFPSEGDTDVAAETGNGDGTVPSRGDSEALSPTADEDAPDKGSEPAPKRSSKTTRTDGDNAGESAPATPTSPRRRKAKAAAPAPKPEAPARKAAPATILTLNVDAEVETPESREDTIWHELQNAYRTRKILTGTLGGIERMDGGGTIAVIYYKETRVVIPLAEMMINLVEDDAHDYGELVQRQNKILGNMLGCEIDFIIKGLENASRSVVASRRDAMYKKRQIFYMPDAAGNSRVCEDRIVQARIIAVAEKVVRVEIFGAECSILARDLSWDWLGDATERFHVGEQILVRILSVKIRSLEDISVKADVKSVNGNTSKDNLGKCKIQGKYAGTVTDIHKGTVFVRLQIGVNAIAHSCYDSRMPGKKDDVSFVVTRIDAERNVAVGLISRIIRQNI